MDSYIYTGPSWAASSYPETDADATNLASLWNIANNNLSKRGHNTLDNIHDIKSAKSSSPIVWIYNEPIQVIKQAVGMTVSDFLTRDDWKDVWNECNRYCLDSIAKLDNPVLLIGAHCDIVDCRYSNITIGHKSWQNFLAEKANMLTRKGKINVTMDDGGSFSFRHCWGAEVVHRYMYENPKINPNGSLIDDVYNIFFFWKQLEKHNLFHDVHPSRRGNELFAEHLKPTVENFLKDNT